MKLLSRVYPLPAAMVFVHVPLTWLYRPNRAEQALGASALISPIAVRMETRFHIQP